VVHYLPHQLLDHLLADDTILLARQFCDRLRYRVDHFICLAGIDFVRPSGSRILRRKLQQALELLAPVYGWFTEGV
jgi:hypothetical protein